MQLPRKPAHPTIALVCTVLATLAVQTQLSAQPAGHDQQVARTDPNAPQPMSLAQAEPRGSGDKSASASAERRETIDFTEDSLTERQSVDAYNSLEDGQPGSPGELALELDFGWQTFSGEHDPFSLTPELKYTLNGSEFLRNTELSLAVPLELGLGEVTGNGDLEFGWLQRWVKEDGMMPTLSTVAAMRIPTGPGSSGVDGKLTGVVAKNLGPGTAYLNGWIETVNGDNDEETRPFQWGFVTGYKWQISDSFALIGDYVHRCSEEERHANLNELEFSGMYKVNEHLTIGPGILIGLDDNEETPNFGAGIKMEIAF